MCSNRITVFVSQGTLWVTIVVSAWSGHSRSTSGTGRPGGDSGNGGRKVGLMAQSRCAACVPVTVGITREFMLYRRLESK